MSDTSDDSDKTEEIREELGEDSTLGGNTDDGGMVLTLDSDDEEGDDE
jgi:hypothetical protein